MQFLIYISIQTLCYKTQNWAPVHSVSIDHPWDVSITWLDSTCGKFNWLERHTPVYIRSHSWQRMSKQKPSHEVKIIVRRAPGTGLCRSTDLGKGTKKWLQHWRSPRTQWPPSLFHLRSLEPPRPFLKLSAWPNWAIGGEGLWSERWPRTWWSLSDRDLEFFCGDGRTFQKDNNLCSTPPIRPLW